MFVGQKEIHICFSIIKGDKYTIQNDNRLFFSCTYTDRRTSNLTFSDLLKNYFNFSSLKNSGLATGPVERGCQPDRKKERVATD